VKALVLEKIGHLEYKEVPDPVPGPGEVLLDIEACGICGSDVHGMDGSTGRRRPPLIMGHEAAGVVARLGEGVEGWEVGDRVTFDSTLFCGHCAFCAEGRVNLCEHRKVFGVSCEEYRQNGALAERLVVPSRLLYKLPDPVSFEQGALVEPLSVAYHAVSHLPLKGGESALVVGTGIIGLFSIQILQAFGCRPVFAVDLDPRRMDVAIQVGASPWNEDAEVDVALEAVGKEEPVAAALLSLRKGGHLALVGNLEPSVSLPLQFTVTRELTLHGSCASAGEYPDCLRLIEEGAVQTDPILSAAAPLEEGADWFQRLRKGEEHLLKVVLRP